MFPLASLPETQAALALSIFFATFIYEDGATLLAATLSASGSLDPRIGLLTTFLGIWVGDMGLYGLWIVPTWSGDGHFHASHRTHHSQRPERNLTQAAVPTNRGEAADRRRDLGRRCIGGAGGAVAWSQRQPGVRLAQAVSGGATQQREPCDQAVAGPRKREFAIASANNSS